MGTWERFRKWFLKFMWPEMENEVEILKMRLATVHGRMQDLYWDGQAKELAASRIAGLEDALWRSCVALHIAGETVAAMKFCEENGIQWDQETADRWRKPAEEPGPAAAPSEGLAFDHPGRHGSWPDPANVPDALNVKLTRGETTAESERCKACGWPLTPLLPLRTGQILCTCPKEISELPCPRCEKYIVRVDGFCPGCGWVR